MLGELNASHMGIGAPVAGGDGPPRGTVGKLGLRFDAAEYEKTGKLRIAEVLPLGPAAIAGIQAGDDLIAVDGVEIGPRTNLDQLLEYKVNARVVLAVFGRRQTGNRRQAGFTTSEKSWSTASGSTASANMSPRSAAAGSGMSTSAICRRRRWNSSISISTPKTRAGRRRGGRAQQRRLPNGTPSTSSRQSYLKMSDRDRPALPRGRCSASARSSGYHPGHQPPLALRRRGFHRRLSLAQLGKVVGEHAGWIIYTSNTTLIDGSSLRLPGTRDTATAPPWR